MLFPSRDDQRASVAKGQWKKEYPRSHLRDSSFICFSSSSIGSPKMASLAMIPWCISWLRSRLSFSNGLAPPHPDLFLFSVRKTQPAGPASTAENSRPTGVCPRIGSLANIKARFVEGIPAVVAQKENYPPALRVLIPSSVSDLVLELEPQAPPPPRLSPYQVLHPLNKWVADCQDRNHMGAGGTTC